MTIKLKVGKIKKRQEKKEEQKPVITKKIPVKRGLDGDLLFLTHPKIDIVLKTDKVLAFAKNGRYTDEAYAALKRLFDLLSRKGGIGFDEIQGGSVYGSLEAPHAEPAAGQSAMQVLTYLIGEFLVQEKSEIYDEYYEEEIMDYLTEPTDEDSTPLGEVPQSPDKGVLPTNPSPVGLYLIYRY